MTKSELQNIVIEQRQEIDKLTTLADAMYHAAHNMSTDTLPLYKAMEAYKQYKITLLKLSKSD